jgi:hypothetical protein
MSFDAWVVGFGIATALRSLHLVEGPEIYIVPAAVLVIDAWLLRRFFATPRPVPAADPFARPIDVQ